MNIEVDVEELRHYVDIISDDATSLENEIKIWNNRIEKLKTIWKGPEAEIFYIRAEEYLKNIKSICETNRVFSSAMKRGYQLYEKTDEELSSNLKKTNAEFEEEPVIE